MVRPTATELDSRVADGVVDLHESLNYPEYEVLKKELAIGTGLSFTPGQQKGTAVDKDIPF
jgi:hypothetical protein